MAYGLKYKSEQLTRNGVTYQLYIYQKDYTGSALYIGALRGLSLELQGSGEEITAPIIKTSLNFTLVDCSGMTKDGYKYSGWEEFYTPDSTLYQVNLLRGGSVVWCGYITPDSWADDLQYRGSLTITARDMLGHMADFDFSADDIASANKADGLCSIENLVAAGLNKCGFCMYLDTDVARTYHPLLTAGNTCALDWLVDLSALNDKTWYEAVESVLESACLCLRYIGGNTICLTSVRALCYGGKSSISKITRHTANFINRTGKRFLDPAYKQIIEKLNYDTCDGIESTWGTVEDFDDWTAEGFTQYYGSSYYQPAAIISSGDWSQNDNTKEVLRPTTKALLNVNDCAGDEDKYLLLAGLPTNAGSNARYNYISANNYAQIRKASAPGTMLNVSFELAHTYNDYGSARQNDRLPAGIYYYAIIWQAKNGTYYSLKDGVWQSGINKIALTIDEDSDYHVGTTTRYDYGYSSGASYTVSHDFVTPSSAGVLLFRIYPFTHYLKTYAGSTSSPMAIGAHARLGNFTISYNSGAVPENLKVTTIYDVTQNLSYKRNVDFGGVPTRFATAGTIRNGFYLPDTNHTSIMDVYWSNDADKVALPLPVYNALQLLAWNAKPNSVISGDLRASDGSSIGIDSAWQFAGRSFVLQGGTFNVDTGIIQDAQIREYDTYDSAIGTASANYSANLSGGNLNQLAMTKSVTAAGASGSASSGGGSAEPYVLPAATWTSLGGVKLGYFDQGAKVGVDINDNNDLFVTLTDNAIVAALGYTPAESGGGSGGTYVLPAASSSALGGIKIGFSESGKNVPVKLNTSKAAYVALSDTAIIAALGYTPAESGGGGTPYVLPAASSSALGGIKIGYSDSGANVAVKLSSQKAYVSLTSDAVVSALGFMPGGGFDRSAPKVSFKNYISGGNEIHVSHPESGTSGAQFVLMCYSKHNGTKHRDTGSGQVFKMHRKKWCLAGGATGDGQQVITNEMSTDTIALYLVHEYLCVRALASRASMRSLSLSQWKSRYNPSTCGFGFTDSSTSQWVGHKNKMFGVALRIPNPDFSSDITSRHNQGTPLVPRYLYTEVTPIFAVIDAETGNIGFSLREQRKR